MARAYETVILDNQKKGFIISELQSIPERSNCALKVMQEAET